MFQLYFNAIAIADDTIAPRQSGTVEQWPGLDSVVDKIPLYNSPVVGLYPRGNASGQIVISVSTSFPGAGGMGNQKAFYAALLALVNLQATLSLNYGGTTYLMTNAVLKSIIPTYWQAARLDLRFTFEISSIT